MNREIKFRAWDKDYNVMHHLLEQSHKLPMSQPLHSYLENRDRFEIMQYTGLKDKNGKEIYEGDIINLHIFTQEVGENLGVREGEKEYIGEISIAPFGVWFNGDSEENSSYLLHWYGLHEESFEIIGNIYENPDLL